MQNVTPPYNKDNYDAKKRYKDILQIKALLFLIFAVIVINFFPFIKKVVLAALSMNYDSVTTGSPLNSSMWNNLDDDFVDVDECMANQFLRKSEDGDTWTCVDLDSFVTTPPSFLCGTPLSYRGKSYDTVEIGTQCWFAKNMDYDNGCRSVAWVNDSDQGWCGYYNGINYNEGLLYQWSAAQHICPSGWHLPTDNELSTLEDSLSPGSCDASRIGYACDPAGDKLKIGGTSGFKALLAGIRYTLGSYSSRETLTYYWSSTPSGSKAWVRPLNFGYSTVGRYAHDSAFGLSVRCLED